VKLVDVSTTGQAFNIASGAVRARYRHSRTAPQPLIPDAIESYDIDLWATSNVFKRGHRIRIEITSSDFPNVNRHPNRFIDLSRASAKDFVTAHQTIVHDRQHPSHIDLPIVPATHRRDWIPAPFPATESKRAYPSLGGLPALSLKEAPGEDLGAVH
jgi:putative CocE/NonD family hydrolase